MRNNCLSRNIIIFLKLETLYFDSKMSWSTNSSFTSSISEGGSGSYDDRSATGTGSWKEIHRQESLDDLPFAHISTAASASRIALASKSNRRLSTVGEVDDLLLYADPDFVTDSGADLLEPGSDKRERRDQKSHFDLERWWLTAPLWIRMLPFLLLLFLVLSGTHLIYAIVCFAKIGQEWMAVPDPYACDTPGCLAIAKTLNATIKPTADPCKDFYEYVCGNYVNMEQDPKAIPDSPRLTHAFQSDTLNAYLSELLKLRGDKSDKAVDFYKACIDEKSRLEVGIDPLLKIIVNLVPTAFVDQSALTEELLIQQTVNFGKTLRDLGAFRFYLQPNYKVALSSPDWLISHSDLLRGIFRTKENRLNFEVHVAKFFEKLWNRMKELKLIDKRPYSGEEAAELLVIILQVVLYIVYDSKSRLTATYSKELTDQHRKYYRELFEKILGQDNFEVVNSETVWERHAFGDWEGRERKPLGSFFILFGPDVDNFLTVRRRKPLPLEPNVIYLQRALAWNALYIYTILLTYVRDIRPKTFFDWGLDKVFPGQFSQDIQRFVRIESYCMTSMVYHLNAFTRFRFYNFSDHETLRKTRVKIEHLSRNAKQSMRRWYTTQSDRAGHFDPYTHHITREFFSVGNSIEVELPLPNLTDTFKASLERRMSYFDNWTVDHFNYLATVVKSKELINTGRLRDWQKNKLEIGDSNIMYLDYVHMGITNRVNTKYRNTIAFPLLLLGPPYFSNDMRVLDYAGTGIYMTRTQLFLWYLNTLDPGPLRIPKEVFWGLSWRGIRSKEECRAVNWHGKDGQATSFANYMQSTLGIHSLAIKLAYDLYKRPDDFEGLIDLETGETFRPIRHKNGSIEFIAPHYFPNGTVVHWYFTKTANGMVTSKPVNKYRFISPETLGRYRLQYKKLLGLEQYNLDQLFFLHSAGDHCFSSHGKKSEQYKGHKEVLNGIYRQVPEFGLAFECSSNSFMNPSDSCFVDDEEVTLGHVSTEDLLED